MWDGGIATDDISIAVFHDFDAAAPAWRRFEEDGVHYPFQSYDWLRHWFDQIGAPAKVAPCLVAIEGTRGGRQMFLPLGIERRLGARCLVWLGGRTSDYHGPILGAGYLKRPMPLASLWAEARRRLPAFDALHLEKQPAMILGHANPFAEGGAANQHQAYATRLGGSWDAYYAAKCGANTRAIDRKKLRRLERQGDVTFRMVPPEEAERTTLWLAEAKSAQLGRIGASDPFATNAGRAFYPAMAAATHRRLRVRVFALELDGRILAAQWGIETDDRFYGLIRAYDEAFAGFSPGRLLQYRVMAWLCGRGVAVYDFGRGDEPYKRDWCDEILELRDRLECTRPRGAVYVAGVATRARLRRLASRVPMLGAAKTLLRRRAKK